MDIINIVDNEREEGIFHKCVRYNKIDLLNYIPIGFNLGIQNKDGDTPLHLAYKKLIYAPNYPAFTKAKNTLLNIINCKNTQEVSPQFIDGLDKIEDVFKPVVNFNYNAAAHNMFMHHKLPLLTAALPNIIDHHAPKPILLPRITLPPIISPNPIYNSIDAKASYFEPPVRKRKQNTESKINPKKHKTIISKDSDDSTNILYLSIANNKLDKNLNPTNNKTTTTTSDDELEKLLVAFSNSNNVPDNPIIDEVELIGSKST